MATELKLLLSMLIMLVAMINAVSQASLKWAIAVYWVLVSIYWMVQYMGVVT